MSKTYIGDTIPARVYALFQGREYVGRIIIKYPNDGAGRVRALVQFYNTKDKRHEYRSADGYATGYGYDKTSAAIADALHRLDLLPKHDDNSAATYGDKNPPFNHERHEIRHRINALYDELERDLERMEAAEEYRALKARQAELEAQDAAAWEKEKAAHKRAKARIKKAGKIAVYSGSGNHCEAFKAAGYEVYQIL